MGVPRWSCVFVVLALVAACGDDDASACDDPAGALARASSGDEVRLGACRVSSDLTVPDGVELVGAGSGETVIKGSIVLTGKASVSDLSVEAAHGTGISVSGSAHLARIEVIGPVTAENATDVPVSPDPADTATHGIAITSAGSADAPVVLEDVVVRGFASFGLLATDSVVSWTAGSASDNLGVGIAADGGAITLTDVEVCRTMSGIRPLPAYGVLFVDGVMATTAGVTVCDNEGVGVLSDGATAVHADLAGADNNEPAVWAQRGGRLEVTGIETVLSGNGVAGVVAVMTSDVSIRDAQIDGTRLTRRLVEGLGNIETGDGIELVVDDTSGVRISDVSLANNERAGVLVDLPDGATVDDASFGSVTVAASGDALGVVAQTPTGAIASGTWDTQVTRDSVTEANDALFTGGYDVVGIIGPMYLPPVR